MNRIESTSFAPEIKGIVLAIAGATAVALVVLALVDDTAVSESVALIAIGIGVVALAAVIVMLPRLVIELGDTDLRLRFVPFRTYRIPKSEFPSMRVVEINASDFGGGVAVQARHNGTHNAIRAWNRT